MVRKANNHPDTLGIYAYSITLSSESMQVSSSINGNNPDLSNAVSTLYIFKLDVDDTVNWLVTKTDSSGVTSTLAGHTVTVTAMSAYEGYIEFRATKGTLVLTKRFNLVKTIGTGISDYLKHKLYESDNAAYNTWLFAHITVTPIAYHYRGTYNRIYFVLYGTYEDANGDVRAGHSTGTWIMYYDLDNEVFSSEIAIPQIYAMDDPHDYHDIPAMIVTDDGYILIVKESLEPSGVHNSYVEFWKSNAPETIEDPGTPGTHYFTKVARFTNGTWGYYSYLGLMKSSTDGELLCFLRANGGGAHHHHLVVAKTEDNGSTWTDLEDGANDMTLIAECEDIAGTGLDWYFYPFETKGPEKIYGYTLFGGLNEGINGTSPDGTPASSAYKYLIFLQSDDGITWNNFAKYYTGTGFSKNILSSGAITAAELKANFVIRDVSTDARESIGVLDSWINKEGIPYALNVIYYTYDNSENPDYSRKDNRGKNFYITTYDTIADTWIDIDIEPLLKDPRDAHVSTWPAFSSNPLIVCYSGETIDVILHRFIDGYDKYGTTHDEITSSADLVRGGIYRITATAGNNFGEGLIVGDYYQYTAGATPTVDGSNKLMPIEKEIVFWRTHNNGDSWYEVREPFQFKEGRYATVQPGSGCSANMHDSGYLATFLAAPMRVDDSGVVYDHSKFVMFIDDVII